MEMKVEHDEMAQKFFIDLGNKEALLAYTEINNIWDIHIVIIPEENRGQGIAEKLALAAFNTAKKMGYKIIPSCSYVNDSFLPKHPEFRDMIVDDFIA